MKRKMKTNPFKKHLPLKPGKPPFDYIDFCPRCHWSEGYIQNFNPKCRRRKSPKRSRA